MTTTQAIEEVFDEKEYAESTKDDWIVEEAIERWKESGLEDSQRIAATDALLALSR